MEFENRPDDDQVFDFQDDDHRYEYPYQQYYGEDNGKRRHGSGHGGWWLFLVVVVLVAGVAGLLSRYSFDLRQTKDGIVLSVQDQSTQKDAQTAEPVPDTPGEDRIPIMTPAPAGGDAELTVAPTRPFDAQLLPGGVLSLKEIYKKVIPSVVSITTAVPNGSSTGTGIVMTRDGYIITNNHVINGGLAVEVLLSDETTYAAKLVGSDETSDLAVLKIDADNLTPAEFGDSERMEVGDAVVAIGDPLGTELRGTMTDGIISAINRDMTVNGRSMTLMQTNAALNNGNSGGPLINSFGQVIGVNTMKMSSLYFSSTVEGLGFAIPIATAKPIIDELIEKGYVSGRPAIGISGDTLPKSAQSYYRLPPGVYVTDVSPGSDAFAKGIVPGDTITAINGVEIATMDGLNSVKNQYAAGDTVTLSVYRKGTVYQVDVILMDRAET